MAQVCRSYRFRLEPTSEQRARLHAFGAARRFVWNWGLEQRIAHYRESGKSLSHGELGRRLTALKAQPDHRWLRDADSQCLQQALADLARAFESFFERKAGFPRFRSSKRDRDRFRIPQRCRIDGNRVLIPKVGPVKVRVSREIDGRLGSATFKEDGDGHWYVTFVVHRSLIPHGDEMRPAVGIDLGIRSLATLDDGSVIENPHWEVRAARRLRREHRKLARCAPRSRRRIRQRKRLAREYSKVARQRRDHLHKTSRRLATDFRLIAIEDLNVRGMARTKLARHIHDAAFRELRRQLEYKAEEHGGMVVHVDRYFPSSRTCSACGITASTFSSRQLVWRCSCGVELDRDVNAARNLLREGLRMAAAGDADAENARGADVRPPTGGRRRRSANPTSGSQE